VVKSDALGRIRRVRELGLAYADQLVPLAHRLVKRLEDLADFQLFRAGFEQRLERAQGVFVLRRRADHLAISGDGFVQITEPRLIHLTEAELEAQDLFRALANLALAREHLGQILPALHLREEPVERTHRDLVLGIFFQHQTVTSYRMLEVFELHLIHLRRTQPELHEPLRLAV